MKLVYSDAKFNFSSGYLSWDNYIYLYDYETLKPSVKITPGRIKIYETKSYFLNEKSGIIKILDWKISTPLPDYMIFFTKHENNLIFFNGQILKSGDNKKIFPTASSGGGVSDHQELENLQGGNETERYHLTQAQQAGLVSGSDASIYHNHASLYSSLSHTHTHNSTTSKQGGTTNEYYHLSLTEHDTLTDGSDASLLHIHNAGVITYIPVTGSDAPLIVTADDAQSAIMQIENYLYNVFGVASIQIGISYTGIEYESLGIYEPT